LLGALRLHVIATRPILAVDCLAPRCGGERNFVIAGLASFQGPQNTVGDVLRRMRLLQSRPAHAWSD
jgi:hypothetical protein